MLSSAMSVEHDGKPVLVLECPEQDPVVRIANIIGPSRSSFYVSIEQEQLISTLKHSQEGHDHDDLIWKGRDRKAATPQYVLLCFTCIY